MKPEYREARVETCPFHLAYILADFVPYSNEFFTGLSHSITYLKPLVTEPLLLLLHLLQLNDRQMLVRRLLGALD